MGTRVRSTAGQATVEWTGLILLVSLALAAVAVLAGGALPSTGLASAIGSRMLCAVGLDGTCETLEESGLAATYGDELAALVAEHAPTLIYEEGMEALPVDYRSCREDPCSMGAPEGEVTASLSGEPVTLFTHAVDCRSRAPSAEGYECSGERAGSVYLQYWAYYPGSRTKAWGDKGFHPDDWESFQVRIGAGGADARASSHHGYNHGDDVRNWASDSGVATKAGWGPSLGIYFIAGGSHAGKAADPGPFRRWTSPGAVRLAALEPIADRGPGASFAITPPWEKRVWSDPEYEGTD